MKSIAKKYRFPLTSRAAIRVSERDSQDRTYKIGLKEGLRDF